MGYIYGNVLDFGGCIRGAYGTADQPHQLVVGDIVAHIQHLIVLEVVFRLELFVSLCLIRAREVNILQTEIFVTAAYAL